MIKSRIILNIKTICVQISNFQVYQECPSEDGLRKQYFLKKIMISSFFLNRMLKTSRTAPCWTKTIQHFGLFHETSQTAHTLYLDRRSRPIVSWHAMLRFYVMFFDLHLTATCCIQGLSFTTFKEILQFWT